MTDIKNEFTHYGWLLMCPIYYKQVGDDGALVAARRWWIEPWFYVNHLLSAFMIWLLSRFNENYEPSFMFLITGEIDKNG